MKLELPEFDHDAPLLYQIYNHDWDYEEYEEWTNDPKYLVGKDV